MARNVVKCFLQPGSSRASALARKVERASVGFTPEIVLVDADADAEGLLGAWVIVDSADSDAALAWLRNLHRHCAGVPNSLVTVIGTAYLDVIRNQLGGMRHTLVCTEEDLADAARHEDSLWVGSCIGVNIAASRSPEVEVVAERRLAKIMRIALRGDLLESPAGKPWKAMIEVARACNLRCPACPVGNHIAQMHPNMSVNVFSEIVQKIRSTVYHLALYNYGEPLLHPHIIQLVGVAKEKGIELVEITTNGNYMPSGLPEGLIEAGLGFLRFSIDGASEESYQKYRKGGELRKVLASLERFRQARDNSASRFPLIEARMILNSFNEKEVGCFKEMAQRAGADRITFKTFNALMSGDAESEIEVAKSFLPMDTRFSRYKGYKPLIPAGEYERSSCHWPYEKLVVNADGSVVPCCYDFNAKNRLGSVLDADWWGTAERHKFRSDLKKDPDAVPICRSCPLGTKRISPAELG